MKLWNGRKRKNKKNGLCNGKKNGKRFLSVHMNEYVDVQWWRNGRKNRPTTITAAITITIAAKPNYHHVWRVPHTEHIH